MLYDKIYIILIYNIINHTQAFMFYKNILNNLV